MKATLERTFMKMAWCGIAVALVVAPASASATVLTYYPDTAPSSSHDPQDLDRQFCYSWTISGMPIAGSAYQINSAYFHVQELVQLGQHVRTVSIWNCSIQRWSLGRPIDAAHATTPDVDRSKQPGLHADAGIDAGVRRQRARALKVQVALCLSGCFSSPPYVV